MKYHEGYKMTSDILTPIVSYTFTVGILLLRRSFLFSDIKYFFCSFSMDSWIILWTVTNYFDAQIVPHLANLSSFKLALVYCLFKDTSQDILAALYFPALVLDLESAFYPRSLGRWHEWLAQTKKWNAILTIKTDGIFGCSQAKTGF